MCCLTAWWFAEYWGFNSRPVSYRWSQGHYRDQKFGSLGKRLAKCLNLFPEDVLDYFRMITFCNKTVCQVASKMDCGMGMEKEPCLVQYNGWPQPPSRTTKLGLSVASLWSSRRIHQVAEHLPSHIVHYNISLWDLNAPLDQSSQCPPNSRWWALKTRETFPSLPLNQLGETLL